jgi:hypothetical protein
MLLPLYSREEELPVSIGWDAEWAPETLLAFWRREDFLPLLEVEHCVSGRQTQKPIVIILTDLSYILF